MGAATQNLLDDQGRADRFDVPYADLREIQIAALNEAFQDRKGRIKLLAHRASEAGTEAIRSLEDIVPLLFPHTAYKSYPESFLIEERWDRLTKWLGSISPHPIEGVDLDGISGIDEWIDRLEAKGYFISCSSGTTGKSAMLIASAKDMAWAQQDLISVFEWGSGVAPAQDRMMMGCAPVASVPRNRLAGEALLAGYGHPDWPRFSYPVPPITVGTLTGMVVMRKRIAEGSATPDEIAAMERTGAGIAADALIENRDKKLMVSGMWGALYPIAKLVREKGYGRVDFHPENCIYVGGGLKRAQLPPDYQEYVHETFNISSDRDFQNYSMQELHTGMPKCRKGNRYHIPPWLVPLILNEEGEVLLPMGNGEVEGRAAFFDLSLDGRWGGVISGDKISVNFGPCACGSRGPSIRNDIARYADLKGDDKIGCAGTVDAYVRGLS
jgi:hypothetical protein